MIRYRCNNEAKKSLEVVDICDVDPEEWLWEMEAVRVLDSTLFTYQSYEDNRVKTKPGFSVGTSGHLLVASGKKDGDKYLVKHMYPHNAANEYVARWLAGKLGVPTPKAWLLTPNKAFYSKYAVAIEFIEGLTSFDKNDIPEELKEELIGQFAFNALIGSADIMQLSLAGGHIYSYDFSEAFYFINDMVFTILRSKEDAGVEMMKQKLIAFRRYIELLSFDIPGLAREFHFDPDRQKAGMVAVAKKILNITEDEIRAMSDELMELYPAAIAVYYEECIRSIQDRIKRL